MADRKKNQGHDNDWLKKRLLRLVLLVGLLVVVSLITKLRGTEGPAETETTAAGSLQLVTGEETTGTASAAEDPSETVISETILETSSETASETVTEASPETEPETEEEIKTSETPETEAVLTVEKDGSYSDRDHVALYIHTYGRLPSNYITKGDAEARGWVSSKGNLWKVAPGCSIGGNKFGNYEGLLPTSSGRKYYECDIDFDGGFRNEKRIIYSNDGLVYYTGDHYESFELLYGEE